MVNNADLPAANRTKFAPRVLIKEPGKVEIAPGIFHLAEPGKHNMIVCKHPSGSEEVVHLANGYEVNYARIIRKGKALRVKGKVAEQESNLTMLFGNNGHVYAVGKAAKTDAKGRVVKLENNNIPRQFIAAAKAKSIA